MEEHALLPTLANASRVTLVNFVKPVCIDKQCYCTRQFSVNYHCIFLWVSLYSDKPAGWNFPMLSWLFPPVTSPWNLTHTNYFIAATCKPDCLNGGTCVNGKCVCAAGYSGPNCNIGENIILFVWFISTQGYHYVFGWMLTCNIEPDITTGATSLVWIFWAQISDVSPKNEQTSVPSGYIKHWLLSI